MGMGLQRVVEVIDGGKVLRQLVDVPERTGDERIRVDEKKIAVHGVPHAGFKDSGADHGAEGRVQIADDNLVEKGEVAFPPREDIPAQTVGQQGDMGLFFMAPEGMDGQESLFRIDVLPCRDQHV